MRSLLRIWTGLFLLFGMSNPLWAQPEFVANQGQWPQNVQFKTSLTAGTIWTENKGFTYHLYDPETISKLHGAGKASRPEELPQHVYKIKFLGSSSAIGLGEKPSNHYYNYILSDDPNKHVTHCAAYEGALLQQVYPGIDVRMYSVSGGLKYDWIVAPGAAASDIRIAIEGAEWELQKSERGVDLCITTSVQRIVEKQPYAYQIIDGKMKEVRCNYRLNNGVVSFELGRYNQQLPLVIDPEVAFSTYIGSPASSWGFTACDDSQGNLIAGAAVFAENYPTTTGAFSTSFNNSGGNYMDVAVSKFSADGSQLLYSTYIGGSLQETPHSIVVDSQDRIILFGVTGSADFPSTPGALQPEFIGGPYLDMSSFFTSAHPEGTDLFVLKLNTDGSMLASTFVGGSQNDGLNYADQLFYNYGDAFRGEVNVDATDNVYVATVTRSEDFPTTSGSYGGGVCDGILFKLSPNLDNLLQSRYIGGNASDACYVVEFSATGELILAGGTQSPNFPWISATGADAFWNGQTDGFIALLDATSLALMSGTYVGTIAYDQIYFAQSDDAGNIYIFGQTAGNMPITPGVYGQPNSGQFISKFSPTLDAMEWNTTIGTGSGAIDISPTAFLVSDCEQIYFSGWGGQINTGWCSGLPNDCYATQSTTFGLPVTADAFQSTTDGSDFYLGVLNPNGTDLLYGSFLGGTLSNEHVDGGTSRFDKNGSVYHAVCAGCGGNSDFPTTPSAWSSTNDSPQCNLAVFRFDLSAIQAEVAIEGPTQVCVGDDVTFNNLTQGASDYDWDFGDGTTSEEVEPVHQFTQGGDYQVQLIGSDNALCVSADTTSILITVVPDVTPTVQSDAVICSGQTIQLQATGSENLHWLYDITLSDINVTDPIASPTQTTTYYVVDENVCDAETLSVQITVSSVNLQAGGGANLCIGQSTQLSATGGLSYTWSPPTYLDNPSASNPLCTPQANIDYIVTGTNEFGCEDDALVSVTVYDNLPGGQTYPDIELCEGESVQLMAAAGTFWNWSPANSLSNANVQDPEASPADTTQYQVAVTNPCGTGVDIVTVNVIHPELTAWGGGSICRGDSIVAYAAGSENYYWRPAVHASPAEGDTVMLFPTETTTFEVTGIDEFNCVAERTVNVFVYPAADIDAGPDAYFNNPDSVQLFGNALGFPCYWWPSTGLSCDSCEQPMASPVVPTVYHLQVYDSYGCVNTDSVYVQPFYPVYVPNVFTPNNDGINDEFFVRGLGITGYHLLIYNRWGVLVFESFDMNVPWLGQSREDFYVPNDVYNWTVEFDSLDRKTVIKGHVTVAR